MSEVVRAMVSRFFAFDQCPIQRCLAAPAALARQPVLAFAMRASGAMYDRESLRMSASSAPSRTFRRKPAQSLLLPPGLLP